MSQARLEVVQGVRGIAAMMVVLMHFKDIIKPLAPAFGAVLEYGYLGVDIFFIISGFIIYVSTEAAAARDSRSFLYRRFCRVVLPAWAAMLLALLVQPPYLRDLIQGVFFIPLQNSNPPFYGYSFLIVAWTLTYELAFYLVFAAVLATAAGRRHRGLAASAVLLAMVAAGQLNGCCTLDATAAPLFPWRLGGFPVQIISLLGNPMLLEFIAGIGLAHAYGRGWLARLPPVALLCSAPLLLWTVATQQFSDGHGLSRGGLLAALLVLYALCFQAWLGQRAAGRQRSPAWVLVYLGEISYSLYLVHPSVKILLGRLAAKGIWSAGAPATFALALLATLVLAHLFYRYVELPSQRLGRYLSGRRRAVAGTALPAAPAERA